MTVEWFGSDAKSPAGDGDRPGRGDVGRADDWRCGFGRRGGATCDKGENGEACASEKRIEMQFLQLTERPGRMGVAAFTLCGRCEVFVAIATIKVAVATKARNQRA